MEVASTIKSEKDSDAALPWVDKYKPTSFKQIIGTKLRKLANNWLTRETL